MANKMTEAFKKRSPFNKVKDTTNTELKELIQDVDKRLTKVEKTLKELLKQG